MDSRLLQLMFTMDVNSRSLYRKVKIRWAKEKTFFKKIKLKILLVYKKGTNSPPRRIQLSGIPYISS
jgi:hypothetical protein